MKIFIFENLLSSAPASHPFHGAAAAADGGVSASAGSFPQSSTLDPQLLFSFSSFSLFVTRELRLINSRLSFFILTGRNVSSFLHAVIATSNTGR